MFLQTNNILHIHVDLADYIAHVHDLQLRSNIFFKHLFSKDALNWSKVTVKGFIVLQKILFQINVVRW